jgi:hypothetical protein
VASERQPLSNAWRLEESLSRKTRHTPPHVRTELSFAETLQEVPSSLIETAIPYSMKSLCFARWRRRAAGVLLGGRRHSAMYPIEDVESDSFGMASYDQRFVIGSSKLFWYEFRACNTVLCCRKWRASKTRRMPFL